MREILTSFRAQGGKLAVASSSGREMILDILCRASIMGLGIKGGSTVTITVEGGNEESNAATMEQFFKDNL